MITYIRVTMIMLLHVIQAVRWDMGRCNGKHRCDLVWYGGGDLNDKTCPFGSTIDELAASIDQYRLLPKDPKKKRIAFIGNSVTVGYTAEVDKKLLEEGKHGYLMNGAKLGLKGFPYRLFELLQKNGKDEQYELVNFGFKCRLIYEREDTPKNMETNSLFESCDYHKALASEADIFIIDLGANDILLDQKAVLKADALKKGFVKLGKTLKNLPQKPDVYMMLPTPIDWRNGPQSIGSSISQLVTQWLPSVILDSAKEIPIASDHIIDPKKVIKGEKMGDKYLSDYLHLTDYSNKLIADMLYQVVFEGKKP